MHVLSERCIPRAIYAVYVGLHNTRAYTVRNTRTRCTTTYRRCWLHVFTCIVDVITYTGHPPEMVSFLCLVFTIRPVHFKLLERCPHYSVVLITHHMVNGIMFNRIISNVCSITT